MVKVLVTGASGMLGGATARALAARGDQVTVLQRRPAGLGLPEVLGDIADPGAVRRAVAGQDAVVHLAAKVNITGAWPGYQRANIVGTAALITACRDAGVPRLVHVSSPSVAHAGESLVGAAAGVADPAGARGAYARSKARGEQLALAADGAGLAVVAVRPHLVWGPGDPQLIERVVARARDGRLFTVGSGAALIDSTRRQCGGCAGRGAGPVHGGPRSGAGGQQRRAAAGGRVVRRDLRGRRSARPAAPGAGRSGVRGRRGGGGGLGRPGPTRGQEDDPPLTRFLAGQLSTAHWFDQRHTRAVLDWVPRVSLDEGFAQLATWYRGLGSI